MSANSLPVRVASLSGEGRSSWKILLDQFKNIMLLMLIAVALIAESLDVWAG